MAADFPTDLKCYCRTFGIDLFDLSLRCIFCKCYLDIVELARFYRKCLCLVWRANTAYAGCTKCLCLSARYEAEKYFQCAAKVDHLPYLLTRPLSEICLRCYYCLALLDAQEKFDLLARGKLACLVRGYWRAPCRECIDRDI
uniref:Protein E6 n=1 Tax=Human papillomavirus TaxID=10566 RepID=A0A385PI90_9PAPI|nr:MAG: E6 protein [Human papillomavirus]